MVSIPNNKLARLGITIDFTIQSVFAIIGWAAVAGFWVDVLVVMLPPSTSLEWRVEVLEQIANRSVVLILGTGFVLISSESRRWLKWVSQGALLMGVALLLSCMLVIYNSIALQSLTVANLNTQATQMQKQIQQMQQSPPPDMKFTAEDLQKAAQELDAAAVTARRGAQAQVIKAGLVSAGNLLVAGVGMVLLGRFGMFLRRNRSATGYGAYPG
jgi:hypothetical protein